MSLIVGSRVRSASRVWDSLFGVWIESGGGRFVRWVRCDFGREYSFVFIFGGGCVWYRGVIKRLRLRFVFSFCRLKLFFLGLGY